MGRMKSTPRFSFPPQFLSQWLAGLQPPAWAVDEIQHRVVLFFNHVLMQEPEAQRRLVQQVGRVVLLQWRSLNLRLAITPAGLFDRAEASAVPDLSLTVIDSSPLELAKSAVRGDKPALRIEGDVQLAADFNWLIAHVRWDVEEDMSRIIGDAPSHALASVGRRIADGLRRFVADRRNPS
jgi:ubiquinone biosynthesis protein UbiJ